MMLMSYSGRSCRLVKGVVSCNALMSVRLHHDVRC